MGGLQHVKENPTADRIGFFYRTGIDSVPKILTPNMGSVINLIRVIDLINTGEKAGVPATKGLPVSFKGGNRAVSDNTVALF